jgi:hypothetical protein
MIKTYQALVTINKQELDKALKRLKELESYEKKVEQSRSNLMIEMRSLQLPTHGTLIDLQQYQSKQYAYIYQLRAIDDELEKVKQAKASSNQLVMLKNIEYEKYLHLEKTEKQKLMKLAMEKEQKELDEIANILYFTKGKS